MISLQLNHF